MCLCRRGQSQQPCTAFWGDSCSRKVRMSAAHWLAAPGRKEQHMDKLVAALTRQRQGSVLASQGRKQGRSTILWCHWHIRFRLWSRVAVAASGRCRLTFQSLMRQLPKRDLIQVTLSGKFPGKVKSQEETEVRHPRFCHDRNITWITCKET